VRRDRVAVAAVLAAITVFGATLRIEALAGRYAPLDRPAWLAAVERAAVPVARTLRPDAVRWPVKDRPYVGGDPINYLRFAREMRHFYQAHVREPVFLALTRGMLWLAGGRDIAVSLASAFAATLAIVATYLLGAAAYSRIVGLGAALALAVEFVAISWSIDGWRDDTFMLTTALSGWAFLRLMQRPSRGRAVVAGAVAAAACLTRITALSFVVPALIWILIDTPAGGRRAASRRVGVAAAVALLLIAPFLINCWRATGDPFFAINYHTRYYRAAENLPQDTTEGAAGFILRRLTERPVTTIDTAGVGLFVFPFGNKWTGFRPWWPHLGTALSWAGAAGLVLALWSANGRLLLVLLITALVPYATTWQLGGGGEWRFTQHVYPIYLVAAGAAIEAAGRAIALLARRRTDWPIIPPRRAQHAVVTAVALAVAIAAYYVLPYFVVRETLAAGEAGMIQANRRGAVFFRGDWSNPYGSGQVIVRAALEERVAVQLPLPVRTDYTLTLRMDAVELSDPAYTPTVAVFLDRHPIGRVHFQRDPHRVGTYRFRIPADRAGHLASRLDLVASHTVAARDAGPRFAELDPDARVSFYLWYVRLEATAPVHPAAVEAGNPGTR
jgi:hypothetical protein